MDFVVVVVLLRNLTLLYSVLFKELIPIALNLKKKAPQFPPFIFNKNYKLGRTTKEHFDIVIIYKTKE